MTSSLSTLGDRSANYVCRVDEHLGCPLAPARKGSATSSSASVLQAWTQRGLEVLEALLQAADLQQLRGGLCEVGKRARPGHRVLQAEGVQDGDLDEPADLLARAQPVELVGAGDRPLALATEAAKLTCFGHLVGVIRRMPEAKLPVSQRSGTTWCATL